MLFKNKSLKKSPKSQVPKFFHNFSVNIEKTDKLKVNNYELINFL